MPATPRAPETERLLARFIRYCEVYTTSDEASESCPYQRAPARPRATAARRTRSHGPGAALG